MFAATGSQVATYLIVVCLFSISFLVFVNATASFVVTTIVGEKENVGNTVGTLGFADEIMVIIACPLCADWNPISGGILSDHVGARSVCVLAYSIIGVALVLAVQAHNVYPQLLVTRSLFGIGAAGASTMITAILPTVVAPRNEDLSASSLSVPSHPEIVPSSCSDATLTANKASRTEVSLLEPLPTRSAGFVGLFSGFGALFAVLILLRLPELIQGGGTDPAIALKDSYYIVGGLAFLMSAVCYFGLRNLQGEAEKSWKRLLQATPKKVVKVDQNAYLLQAVTLSFHIPSLGLAYFGGFVARASSIGITLFIPLLINTYFISSGLCDKLNEDTADINQRCRSAYVLSAELTGTSQLVGLLFAPIFGYLADKYQRSNMLLLIAAFSGCLGYFLLATIKSPRADGENGSRWIFIVVALIGINQIGAIICSLGLLSRCVLGLQRGGGRLQCLPSTDQPYGNQDSGSADGGIADNRDHESVPLLKNYPIPNDLQHLKGSIAGVYSFSGGLGILLLTKVGGLLFDKTTAAPFLMLSLFNALLLLSGVICWFMMMRRRRTKQATLG